MPKIYAENKINKFISHNYCHAGEGYSILFSTVEKSVQNILEISNIPLKEEITIIGMGVIGLTTALKLIDRGYTNIKIIGEKYDNTASFAAGGLIEMVCDYKGENLTKMNKFFEDNFFEYKEIVEGKKYPFLKSSMKEVDFYTNYFSGDSGIGSMIKKGFLNCEKVNLKLCDNSKVLQSLKVFNTKTFQVVPLIFMESLLTYLKSKGVIFETKKINNFEEVPSKYVFNCSGLGSLDLNNDKEASPICGHALTLSDESLSKLNYILTFKNIKGLTDVEIEDGSFYFMPKSSGFIGGSFIEGYYGDDEAFNKKMIRGVIERAKLIFNGIKPGQNGMSPKF